MYKCKSQNLKIYEPQEVVMSQPAAARAKQISRNLFWKGKVAGNLLHGAAGFYPAHHVVILLPVARESAPLRRWSVPVPPLVTGAELPLAEALVSAPALRWVPVPAWGEVP